MCNTLPKVITRHLCVDDVTNMVHTAHAQVTWCCSVCYVPSGLDFEADGDSVARYCLSNYLLQGHRVTVNTTLALFLLLNAETVERMPTPIFGILVKCSAHGHSFVRLCCILTCS